MNGAQRKALQRIKAAKVAPASSDVKKLRRLADEYWTPKQRAATEDDSDLVAVLGSRRAGKTSLWNLEFLIEAASTPDGRFLYVNETSDECRQLAWEGQRRDGMASLVERLGLAAELTEDPMEIYFPKINSRIRLKGADDVRGVKKLLGGAWHRVWWDEAQKIPPTLTDTIRIVLMPTLLDYGGKLLLTGTPVEDMTTWFYEITREEVEQRIKGWSVHRWNLLDNPWFGRALLIGDRWWVISLVDTREGPFETEEEARVAEAAARYRNGIEELCKKLGTATGPLTPEDPEIQRDGFGRWTASGVMFTYKVNRVPDSILFYAPDRRIDQVVINVARLGPDGLVWEGQVMDRFPDITKALKDLPEYETRDYWFGVGMDIGFSPDPFTICLVAWCMEDPCLYEVGSWGSKELDAEIQRAVMMHFASKVTICAWVADAGGGNRPQVQGWSESWKLIYGIPVIESKKNEKNLAIEDANGSILRGVARFRIGSPVVTEMRRVQWVKSRTGKGALVEAKGIPNDFCLVAGTMVETSRGQVPIEQVAIGDRVWTRAGLRAVTEAGPTGEGLIYALETAGGRSLLGTRAHPVLTERGWVELQHLTVGDTLTAWGNTDRASDWSSTGRNSVDTQTPRCPLSGGTFSPSEDTACTEPCGSTPEVPSRPDTSSITRTATTSTTGSTTSCSSSAASTRACTPSNPSESPSLESPSSSPASPPPRGTPRQMVGPGTPITLETSQPTPSSSREPAWCAEEASSRNESPRCAVVGASPSSDCSPESTTSTAHAEDADPPIGATGTSSAPATAVDHVARVRRTGVVSQVFNLRVDGDPEFFANGILTHNCDAWLYINRLTMPHRRGEPQAQLPAPGSPEEIAAAEDRVLEMQANGRTAQGILLLGDIDDPDDPDYEG